MAVSAKAKLPTMKSLLEANTKYGQHRIGEVFEDFCSFVALAIRNSVDLTNRQEREDQYLRLTKKYEADDMNRFAQVLALLTEELTVEMGDVLGRLYMTLDMGNEGMGQFFTPYHVSVLMAQLTLPESLATLETQDFITMNEPTCGAGGMVIALVEALHSAGINYQQRLHVTAQDLSLTAVQMTYIQLSLLHVPAVVLYGDTLTMEVRDAWYTPAHILGGWGRKLLSREGV